MIRAKTYREDPVDLDKDEGLPAYVGYDHLDAVADRLCRAFENPIAYAKLGGKAPRGAVLTGPPGTGKTLFAKYLAKRLGVPLFAPNTAQMTETPEAVRGMLQQVRQQAPCVLLLDEAAALVGTDMMGGHLPGTAALLAEIDGAEPLEGVLIVATLNHGRVAAAITRPGRLHELHQVGLPQVQDRARLWKAYLKNLPTEQVTDDTPWEPTLVRASRGFSGADIAEALRRAGGDAVAAGHTQLALKHLVKACDAIYWDSPDGSTGGRQEELWKTAIHEAGHALLAWRHGLEVQRITVRPRRGALGMVAWDHEEDRHSFTRSELFGEIQMALGGIVAEQVVFGEYSNGGSADLRAVHGRITMGLTTLGFGHIGPVYAGLDDTRSNQRRLHLEEETSLWASHAFEEASQWLTEQRKTLESLATQLMAERDVSGADLDGWQTLAQRSARPKPVPPVYRRETLDDRPGTWPGFRRDPSLEGTGAPSLTIHQANKESA